MNAIAQFQPARQDVARQERVAARLCEREPVDNLKHMETVSKGYGLGARIIMESRRRADGDYYTSFRRAEFLVSASNDKRKTVLEAFKEMLTPATEDMIIGWLALLAIKTSKKNASEKDKAGELKVYAADLDGYPADVVQYALQAKHYRWWPPVGDILKICEDQVRDRVEVINKLQSLIIKHDQDDYVTPAQTSEKVRTKADFESIDSILRNTKFVPKVGWKDE